VTVLENNLNDETPRLTVRVRGMSCRHCVREVTRWLRDVPGVRTVTADAAASLVALGGSMAIADVLAALRGSSYVAEVVDDMGAAREEYALRTGRDSVEPEGAS
jgi:copper chaperone CopZ